MIRRLAPLALTLVSSTALAHGGAPFAESLAFVDGKPHLVTTFGVIFQNAGNEWILACEEAVSPGPKRFSLNATGDIGLGHASGFATSQDYCDYTPAPEVTEAVEQVVRVRPPSGDGVDAIVLFLSVTQTGRNLRISTDGGATFAPLTIPTGLHANAVIADATTPGRLWISAQDRANGGFALVRTDDLGATWSTRALGVGTGVPRVASAGPSGLFVRVSEVEAARLLRSDDQGATFDEVLSTRAVYYSFVKDFGDGEVWTAETNARTLRSRDAGLTWTPVELGGVTCIERTGERLWACVIDIPDNHGLLTSDDDGATWTPHFKYSEVTAMLSCPAGSAGAICEDYWLLSAVGMKVPTGQAPDGGTETPADPQPCCSNAGGPGLLAMPLLALLVARRRQRSLSR